MFLLELLSKCAGIGFGFIIGPSGFGKTFALREVCNTNPKVVLYYEIREPTTFVAGLSKELG